MSGIRSILGCAAIVLAASCVPSGPDDPVHVVVATFDQQQLTLADFQDYLQMNLPREPGQENDAQLGPDERIVHSRLLDAFVDEALLVGEARRRGIRVPPALVEQSLQDGGDGGVAVSAARRANVVRRLTLSRLEELIARDLPMPTDAEVDAELARTGRNEVQQRVEFRSVRFERREDADRAHQAIKRGRQTLDEILVAYAIPPDQGVRVELAWSSLSPALREILGKLRPGRVSDPQELDGGIYLFRVESKSERPAPAADEAMRHAVRDRLSLRRRQAELEELLASLHRSSAVRLETTRLPFAYVAEGES